MDHETAEKLKKIAFHVADQLMTALKNGDIPKIGIDEVRAALKDQPGFPEALGERRHLETLTLRRILESVR